jgi:hypothetical protein
MRAAVSSTDPREICSHINDVFQSVRALKRKSAVSSPDRQTGSAAAIHVFLETWFQREPSPDQKIGIRLAL